MGCQQPREVALRIVPLGGVLGSPWIPLWVLETTMGEALLRSQICDVAMSWKWSKVAVQRDFRHYQSAKTSNSYTSTLKVLARVSDLWNRRLVGGCATPLKKLSSSVGMMKFPIWWKVIKKNMFQTTNQIEKKTYKTNLRIIIPTIGENKIHVPNHQPEEPTNQQENQFASVSSQAKESKESKDQCPTEDRNPHPTLRSLRECEGTDLTSANSPGKTGNQTCHQEPTRTNRTGTFLSIPWDFFHLGKPPNNGSFSAGCQLFSETEWLFQ